MILAPAGPMTLYPHIYKSLSYGPRGDFAPVSTVCSSPLLLAVGPLVPVSVRTVADFIACCRANPKQSRIGLTVPHFQCVRADQMRRRGRRSRERGEF